MIFRRILVPAGLVTALMAISGASLKAQEREQRSGPPPIPQIDDLFDEQGNLDPRRYLDRQMPGGDDRRPPDRERDRQPPQPPQPPDDRDRDDGRERDDGRDRDEVGRGPSTLLVPPRDPRRGQRWRLGVYTQNTQTGVIVTGVISGTPAWEAGLEQGDSIVTVDGYQIGYVNNRLYELGDELQRRADRNGRVTLLVQNRRNARLVNIDVDLAHHQ